MRYSRRGVRRLLTIGLAGLAVSAGAQTQLSASQFVLKSTGGASGSDYNVWSNGYIGTFLTLKNPATVTLNVQASGQAAKRIWPIMGIHVGNREFKFRVGQAAFATYSATVSLPAGTTFVRIAFTNDYYDSGANQDRNLIVRDLTVSTPAVILNPTTAGALKDAIYATSDSTIENYRKQDASITISAGGKPLANTSVRVHLIRHAFNFGTAVAGIGGSGDPMWPNPAAGSNAEKFQKALAANFNTVSLENCGKWAFSESSKGAVTLGYADAIYDFAKANSMRARYHTLLWGDSQPQWVIDLEKAATGGDAKAAAAAKAALSDAIKARAAYIAKDRGQKFVELDGINEASDGHQPIFLNIYGYSGIADIYRNAIAQLRAGKSLARVYFNDYNILNYGPDNFASWYLGFMHGVIDTGMTAPELAKMGVGIQYYHFGGGSHDPVRVFQSLANLGALGLPISITEFGADNGLSADAQAILPDTLRLIFGNDQATTFNTWGFYAPWMWITGAAFFDANWNITPVGKIWQQVTGIKNWNLPGVPSYSTDVTLKTDAAGKVSLRGFLGDYEVVSGLLKGAVTVKPGVADYAVRVKR